MAKEIKKKNRCCSRDEAGDPEPYCEILGKVNSNFLADCMPVSALRSPKPKCRFSRIQISRGLNHRYLGSTALGKACKELKPQHGRVISAA